MNENEFDVFISYSRKDSEIANRIYDALEAEGIHCFIDKEGISGGADFPTVLSEAIMGAKVLLLVASENSYASEFTQKELTFAVSNKGSRFIFPVIVDDSTLPKNLEFLLSNINWRTLSSKYRIEKEMVDDVKKKLADPTAGMTLKQREKNTVKWMMTIIFIIIGAGLAALDQAEVLLGRVDSLRETYMNDATHAFQFTQYTTAATRRGITERRDSMFVEWNKYAHDNYEDYEFLGDDTSRDIALDYVEKALILHPADVSLQYMKTDLTKE